MIATNFYYVGTISHASSNLTKIEKLIVEYATRFRNHLIVGDEELNNFQELIKKQLDILANSNPRCKKPDFTVEKAPFDNLYIRLGYSLWISIVNLKFPGEIINFEFAPPFLEKLQKLEVNESKA